MTLQDGPGAFSLDHARSDLFFTQMSAPRVGFTDSSPHGRVQIFYSRNIEPVIGQQSFMAPSGTVAIKDQDRNSDGMLENFLVMIKQPAGYDPEHGDWLYEVRGADGTPQSSGKQEFCIGCHDGWPGTDRLAGTMLRD